MERIKMQRSVWWPIKLKQGQTINESRQAVGLSSLSIGLKTESLDQAH